jgi:hypothetical protein
MAVFRVEKTQNYTVMSNHHLRNASLSLKAKGLLSQILSLPENWDYTLSGLSKINRESVDAIRTAVQELERAGYITRSRERRENGQLGGAEYVIHEQPSENFTPDNASAPPITDPSTLKKPMSENPIQATPILENPMQLNKEYLRNTDLLNTDSSSTDSIPIPSPRVRAENPERKGTEAASMSAFEVYREIIKENIEYPYLLERHKFDQDRIDEIVDLMLETVCTARKTIRIAGDDYPAELVKSKFLKLDSEHIDFVLDCLKKNTTEIHNIKKYLLAMLFNAPSTIGSYYTALVSHDMASGKLYGDGDDGKGE